MRKKFSKKRGVFHWIGMVLVIIWITAGHILQIQSIYDLVFDNKESGGVVIKFLINNSLLFIGIGFIVVSLVLLYNDKRKEKEEWIKPDFPMRSAINYIKDKTVFGIEKDWQSIVYETEKLAKAGKIHIWAKHDLDGDFIELFPPKLHRAHFECQQDTVIAKVRFFDTGTYMIDVHFSKKEVEKKFEKC